MNLTIKPAYFSIFEVGFKKFLCKATQASLKQ